MTHVRIEYDTHYDVTREADPSDRWDRDDTYAWHIIREVRAVGEKDYYDLVVDFEPKGTACYLLFVIYDTGDSFGVDQGQIEFIGLYRDRKVAEENKSRIEKLDYKDKYSVQLVTEDGRKYKVHAPWIGYFERFQYADIQQVLL